MAETSVTMRKTTRKSVESSGEATLRLNETQETSSNVSEMDQNRLKWVNSTLYSKLAEKNQPYKDIVHEFKIMKDWKPPQITSIVWRKNPDKNRYGDQMCMDQTRVILKERESDNNYINASWMLMPDGRRWISTQGPTKLTVEDFWHMIYTENVRVVCMLCSFAEDSIEKSREYFNLEGKRDIYGPYRVKIKTKPAEIYPGIKMTKIEVDKKSGKTKTITHLWHTEWVDHFCPTDTMPCVSMFKMALEKSEKGPIVVHCSAGIGRTATFVGIDYATQKINVDPDVKMCDIFCSLRKMRLRAIQSPLQYAFLHQCLAERFAQEGSLKRDENFEKVRNCFETMVKKLVKAQMVAKGKYYSQIAEKGKKEK